MTSTFRLVFPSLALSSVNGGYGFVGTTCMFKAKPELHQVLHLVSDRVKDQLFQAYHALLSINCGIPTDSSYGVYCQQRRSFDDSKERVFYNLSTSTYTPLVSGTDLQFPAGTLVEIQQPEHVSLWALVANVFDVLVG